jgi:hypothetical protein
MKVILQAGLVSEHYRQMWDDWFKEFITGGSAEDLDVNNLIIMLVADGLWYANKLGNYNISTQKKQQIVNKLLSL